MISSKADIPGACSTRPQAAVPVVRAGSSSPRRAALRSGRAVRAGQGTTTVVFMSTPISTRLQVAQLEGERVGHHRVRRIAQRRRCEGLAFGVDDLGRFSRSASA